ncbi:MAG: hypothetical protein V2A79_08810, partial [Planctomycetota bacterium]
MKRMTISSASRLAIVLVGLMCAAAQAQISFLAGDGVLNAPYRGTINSLREATMDVAYGEVKSHVEPFQGTLHIVSFYIDVWTVGDWDRSVLRLYEGLDASGNEVDLTGHDSQANAVHLLPDADDVKRFSIKAIGTKTLAAQTFSVTFFYDDGSGPNSIERTFRVAPVTGSFSHVPSDSEAFNYGTPILDVSVGAARLVVPVGRTLDMIGAAFIGWDKTMGPSNIPTTDVLFPGAAESVYIQTMGQFRKGTDSDPASKPDYGTPWPGYLVGYFSATEVWGPDDTLYASADSSAADRTRRLKYIRPFYVNDDRTATQEYSYDANDRVTQIADHASPSHSITLLRTTPGQVTVSTSDGRSWTIQGDTDGRIVSLVPEDGKGARYFKYVDSSDPALMYRVTQVRLGASDGGDPYDPDLGDQIMCKFVYDLTDGDLREEWRYVDGEVRKVVEHIVDGEGHRQRKEWFGIGASACRVTDFLYDTGAGLKHCLASSTSYSGPNGTGTPYTTTYTHSVANPRGNMVITRVDLPDGTRLDHEYDAQYSPQIGGTPPAVDAGFRTRTTRTGPTGSLVTYDVNYEFFYPVSANRRLFWRPRLSKQRDGRGVTSEVVFDYENGNADQNNDDLNGERSNQLVSRIGPVITNGYSGTRTPATRYFYYDNLDPDPNLKCALKRVETDYAFGQHRDLTFGYDTLLRLTTQTVDPSGENLVTRYLYCDTASTQARTTVDPDGYWTRSEYDNDGRVAAVTGYLNPNPGEIGQPCAEPAGPFYETTSVYDVNGRLYQRIVENKDQAGDPLSPATITTESTYDRLGRLTLQTVDPGGIGQESNFVYNWLGDVTQQFDTTGRGVLRTFDGRGLVDTETPLVYDGSDDGTPDPNLTTTFQYDALGRLCYTYPPTYPAGPHEERAYDDFGRLEQVQRIPGTDGGNLITTTLEYDAADHVTRTYVDEAGVGILTDSTALYDEGGFKYESRQRTVAGVDGGTDPVTQWKFDWAGNGTEERALGDTTVADGVINTFYDGA